MLRAFPHDPHAVLDYYLDWSAWLAGDSLQESTWVADDEAIVLADEAIVGNLTQVWVSGGTRGIPTKLTNHITTVGGRADDRTILLKVLNR